MQVCSLGSPKWTRTAFFLVSSPLPNCVIAQAQSPASAIRALEDRRDSGLGTAQGSRERHPVCGAGKVSMRSADGAVLAGGKGGKSESFLWISGGEFRKYRRKGN